MSKDPESLREAIEKHIHINACSDEAGWFAYWLKDGETTEEFFNTRVNGCETEAQAIEVLLAVTVSELLKLRADYQRVRALADEAHKHAERLHRQNETMFLELSDLRNQPRWRYLYQGLMQQVIGLPASGLDDYDKAVEWVEKQKVAPERMREAAIQEVLKRQTEDTKPPFRCTPYADVLEEIAKEIRALSVAARGGKTCDHQWIDMRNEVITDGEMCKKCNAIRAGNQEAE